jgi:hypothetical protein
MEPQFYAGKGCSVFKAPVSRAVDDFRQSEYSGKMGMV